MQSMEGQVVGRELTWPRAERWAALVPTVGAAVSLFMAGLWTGSGNEVGEKQSRPEDEAAHTCQPTANEQRAWCRTPLEARTVTFCRCSPGAGANEK